MQQDADQGDPAQAEPVGGQGGERGADDDHDRGGGAGAGGLRVGEARGVDGADGDTPGEWNPSDYAYHLTRRPRGLPLWFSLAVHGTDAYRDAVARGAGIARWTADRVRATDGLELLREPELTVVLVRRTGWRPEDYYAWSKRLLASGTAFVTPSVWEGETVARLAFLHPGIGEEAVGGILDSMVEAGS
ncbi:hypothetical protein ACFXPZ_04845 [Streptomyces sp. NPDC059101]|uniref:hypothetical protein n=1 Tax=unclassified Streptomyces TaxID=2593676 RepID=UPI0036C82CC7